MKLIEDEKIMEIVGKKGDFYILYRNGQTSIRLFYTTFLGVVKYPGESRITVKVNL